MLFYYHFSKNKKELEQAKKRIIEIDNLFMHIYEDNISGKITDERFRNLSFNNVLYVFTKTLFPFIDKLKFLSIFVSITANIPLNSFFIFLYRPYPIISIELI